MIAYIKRKIKSYICAPSESNSQIVYSEFPVDFSKEEIDIIRKVKDYTMTSNERLVTLARAIDYIEEHNIEGDIIECGVWRGGSMMLVARKLLAKQNTSRNLFLFDTFEGMTEPTEADKLSSNDKAAKQMLDETERTSRSVWCIAPLDGVKNALQTTEYPKDKIHFIKGKVEETLPHKDINKIAILRLDTDWYESTKHELETLFEKLEPGGILIIDDYGHWTGAKKAVDEYIKENNIKIFLNRIDYTGRLGIKI